MKHVFIFGAGASRECNGPLMSDFLDRAERLRRTSRVDQAAFDLAFRGVEELQIVHAKATLDTENIENVMAAFEMAALLGELGRMDRGDVAKLPDAITTLVANTVEESVQFDFHTQGVRTAGGYTTLIDVIKEMQARGDSVSLVTFNYDLGLDLVIDNMGALVDLGLEERDATHPPGAIPLLKLHGSLSWTTRNSDDAIYAVPLENYTRNVGDMRQMNPFRLRDALRNHKAGLSGKPVIVPPTWGKASHYKNLRHVWARAGKALREAESIVVFGYSLPPSDEFFRLLYALGTVGPVRLKRFWVFDPDTSVESRFENLLGPEAKRRFRFFPAKFSPGVGNLRNWLASESTNSQ